MNKVEVKKLFLIINNCYSNFQFDDIKISVWQDLLKNVPFETGHRNLREYVETNRFLPTPADIINKTKMDLEAEARNIEIAFCKYVNAGGDPDTYVYEPADGLGNGNTPKLRG